MANINRDYLIVLDAKSSVITEADNLMYYIVDEHSPNLFVNLVVRDTTKLNQYVEVHDPANYKLELHIVKPNNDIVNPPLQGTLLNEDDAIYSFVLPKEATDYIGSYKCELRVIYQETEETTITTSNKFKYRVKKSIYNNLDGIVDAPEYPLVIQLLDKLSDINQYEEDRRANELARQLAEEQRQTRFDALDADMVDKITAMDNKMVDVENRVSAKEQAVDKLITDTKANIDEYKVAKDQEIDDYKAAKDTEINNAITAQDNKIDEAINAQNDKINTTITTQNDRITAIENNVVAQNDKLDTLETKATTHEARITAVETKNTEQDNRLDIAENRLANIGNDITNTMQPIIDEHTSRLEAIEAIDVSQNTRLDAIETKNQQQDDRLLDIEKVNNRQDIDIKCLYGASQTIDVTKESNSIYLQNSNNGFAIIDEIKGNTLVNCNKEPDKEIILNGNINTQGYSNITLNKGVDGGKVDVALEGNTLVNVSKTKDSTALPLEEELTYLYANTQYTVQFISTKAITADITLGGAQLLAQNIVAELNRISITTPETLVDNKLIINGVGANISEVVVTDTNRKFAYFEGMKSVGECEELEVKSGNKNILRPIQHPKYPYFIPKGTKLTLSTKDGVPSKGGNVMLYDINGGVQWFSIDSGKSTNTITTKKDIYYIQNQLIITDTIKFQVEIGEVATSYVPYTINTQTLTHEPLRGIAEIKDKYVLIDGKWYIERNCGVRAYQEGDIDNYITDKINTVYPLPTPTYEPIDYNPFEVYSDVTHISNNSTIPCNMTIKNTGYNCLLKPSTTYTVSSNLGLNTVTTPSVLTEDCLRFMDTDTSDITTMRDVLILEGDWTTKVDLIPANFSGIESCFEQEYDAEKGKYKVDVKVANEDKTKENNITFYINEPLRGVGDVKDRVYIKDDKVVVERKCGQRAYQDGDFGTYLTDKVNTVYPLAEPTYEEVEYNDVKLFIESFKNSTLFYNSNIPVTSKLYYSYSVPIVDTVAQTASISDQQDSMIIDLATQVAVMEMMLM